MMPSSVCLPAIEPQGTRDSADPCLSACAAILIEGALDLTTGDPDPISDVSTGDGRRGLWVAGVEDADPLIRAAALAAVSSLCHGCGSRTTAPGIVDGREQMAQASCQEAACLWGGPVRLVGVHGLAAVARCPLRRRAPFPPAGGPLPLRLLYVSRDRLAAQLHLLHGCADVVALLSHTGVGPRFELLEDAGPLAAAGLTPREVDVLALLLARATNEEIAAATVISQATVRAHCRAVLRKLGAARRQDLWRMFARGPV